MKKNLKTLAIIFSVVLNMVFIGCYLYHGWGSSPLADCQVDPGHPLYEQLGLSPGQLQKFRTSHHRFHAFVKEQGREIKARQIERVALLYRLLENTAGRIFTGGSGAARYVEPVDRLFGHLISEDVTPEAFERSVDSARQPGDFERFRDTELAGIYRRYLDLLRKTGLRDPRGDLIRCAHLVERQPDHLARAMGGLREIRIYGLLDLRSGWRRFLEALHTTNVLDRVLLYAAEGADLPLGFDFSHRQLPEAGDKAIRLFQEQSSEQLAAGVEIIEAPNAERELGEVAGRIRRLVDEGVDPHDIAVVVRSARPLTDMVLRYLKRYELPVTGRVRLAYSEIPVVRAILGLFRAAAEGWTRHELVELAGSQCFEGLLDAGVINSIGFRRRVSGLAEWSSAIAELSRNEDELSAAGLSVERAARASESFERFRMTAGELDERRSRPEWIEWLLDFIESDPWEIEAVLYRVPYERYDIIKRDLVGWRGLVRILSEWRTAEQEFREVHSLDDRAIGAADFHARLVEMLAGDAGIWTETFRGVQVTEALAHVYRSSSHLFLVGLEAGSFPRRQTRSPLLDDSAVAILNAGGLNLESREEWDVKEQVLFSLLINGADNVTASYARLDITGREAIRSTFVEVLMSRTGVTPTVIADMNAIPPSMPLVRSWETVGRVVVAARVEHARELGTLTAFNGVMESETAREWLREHFGESYLWSPTQLEAYVKCPWAYFSRYILGLERREEPGDEIDARLGGTIVHKALKLIYDRAAGELGEPVFLRAQHLDWISTNVPDAVNEVVAELAGKSWLGHPGIQRAAVRDIVRLLDEYLQWEAQFNEDMFNRRKRIAPRILRTGVIGHELHFPRAVLERNGVTISYQGTIDRLEIGIDERIDDPGSFVAAVDYKMTTASTPGAGNKKAWEDGVLLQLPLYAHALAGLTPGRRPARVEYRSVRGRETVHTLAIQSVDPKSEIRVQDRENRERLEKALDTAVDTALKVRDGMFPADPAPSCGCPPFCHARDICRVAGGPREVQKWR